jgi:hypothetical protein
VAEVDARDVASMATVLVLVSVVTIALLLYRQA